jgi:hypothetical protein
MRPELTPELADYLRTGKTKDAEVFLDWTIYRNRIKLRTLFLEIHDDFPPGTFPWAQEQFGGGR